ncbi:hypothetical protein MRX96_045296 [Rhipicephalus microplus]
MSATPHAHAIRLPFVQSLTLMCLLTSFHGPPCVADGDPMFVGHQLLHPSTVTVFVQRDPGSKNERRVLDDLRKHTPAYVIAQLPHALSFCGCFTATSTTLTSQQHYIRPDKTSPASSGLGSMSATPHAHAIRLPFVQSLTLMCLLTSFHGPPCVADGDPMFVGHQLLHPSTVTVFVQRDPGSKNERRVIDDLRKHTPAYVIAQLPYALSFCGCFTTTSTTLTSQQHYIRPDKTSPASSGLGSMTATPHAHAIRLPFVQSLTLMCLLTSFHGPPCVADGDPMFVGPSCCILQL